MPRASWTVIRLVWMQIALCTAIIVEKILLHNSQLANLFELNFSSIFPDAQVWRLFTATLVHLNPFQLLFNMLALWMFGSELEQRWGRGVFLRFYILCALASSATFLALGAAFPAMRTDTFSNSTGIVLALLIAYAIYWPDRQVWFFFLFPLRMKYVALITGVIAILYAVSSAPFVLSAAGHVGGLVCAGLILLLTGGEPHRLNRPFVLLQQLLQQKKTQRFQSNTNIDVNAKNLEIQIDAILDKISRGGMKSLSPEEKQFLRAASEKMNRPKT